MADIHVSIIRAIESGLTHRQAAERHGFQRPSVIGLWKRYKRKGIQAMQAIRLQPDRIGVRKPADPDYDAKWVANIKARCITSEKGCWLWQGTCNPKGYGCYVYRDRAAGIHRTMYRLHNQVELKTSQYVLHRCDIRNCCNPDHLFLGTAKVNNWDCALKGRHHFKTRTQCPQGHPYDETNTVWLKSASGGLARNCRECGRIKSSQYYYANKAKIRARERARKLRDKA